MSKIKINPNLNPNFILYNIVFSSNPLPTINTKNLVACMKVYGIKMDEKHIQKKLDEWYASGLLRLRAGSYVIA